MLGASCGQRVRSAPDRHLLQESGANFRRWTLRQVLKCAKRTIGPYRRLITRHELGGWNVVSDAHEQAQTDARQGGCR